MAMNNAHFMNGDGLMLKTIATSPLHRKPAPLRFPGGVALEKLVEQQANVATEVITRMVAAAETRGQEMVGHNKRTGTYAGIIARGLGLPEDYVEMIVLAASMHDIGKIGIPDAILTKPGQLTGHEFEVVKTHTIIGEQILAGSPYPLLQMAESIALSHHERWDGSGYPYGLAGEQIPLASRIVMLADQYDALRSRRVYKPSLDHATTCAILSGGDAMTQPDHFDPAILKMFLKMEPLFAEVSVQKLRQAEAPLRLPSRRPALYPPARGGWSAAFPVSPATA